MIPLVSVIIPTYGRPALALDCIESVRANRYPRFEILIIDQGPDHALESSVAERFGTSTLVRYVRLAPPGLNRARNLGLREAQGEIVAFIDDDAVADQDWLEGIAAAFTEVQPTPGLVGGRLLPLWPGARPAWLPLEGEVLLGIYDIGNTGQVFPGGDLPIGANMSGNRQAILSVGGFHEGLEADAERPGVELTGGDSMIGQLLKAAGHTLYYEPRATVHHRISASKLRLGAFVKRYFWEGRTEATRLILGGAITPTNVSGVRSHHLRALANIPRRALAPSTWRRSGQPSSRAVATLMLARAAHSLGILYATRSLSELSPVSPEV
jgi:glucosyl-dolichyl phosphate glucuronosyltransferase